MKRIIVSFAALAALLLVGTGATFASSKGDCCPNGDCCQNGACCHRHK
ncbi:MAG TPA: hypothetical protein VMJ34_05625 [Bryobacteraceae bacterium]|nr:hypothetical protein [Bryobacteraceae bacterium]